MGEGGGRLLLQQGEINSVIHVFEISNGLQYLSVTGADQVNSLINLFFHRGFSPRTTTVLQTKAKRDYSPAFVLFLYARKDENTNQKILCHIGNPIPAPLPPAWSRVQFILEENVGNGQRLYFIFHIHILLFLKTKSYRFTSCSFMWTMLVVRNNEIFLPWELTPFFYANYVSKFSFVFTTNVAAMQSTYWS